MKVMAATGWKIHFLTCVFAYFIWFVFMSGEDAINISDDNICVFLYSCNSMCVCVCVRDILDLNLLSWL